METELKMSIKEADRYAVMKQIEMGKTPIVKASLQLGLTYRQTRRLWKNYQREGPQGLVSKRIGKLSNHQLPKGVKEKAMRWVTEKYADYGPTLAKEKLEEKHSLKISKETLRQLMIQEGLWRPKKKKEKKVYSRRTRRSCKGELNQIDGSYEYWFEDRANKCCLLVSVDDATSELMALKFCKVETTDDYFELVKDYLYKYGRPMAFYSDKHSIFRVSRKTLEPGERLSSLHKALKKLQIELICAHSPQAKGRVERANGILQDRLIKELREQKISSIREGNAYLETFRQKYNKKFGKKPAKDKDAHRALLPSQDLDGLLIEKKERKVSKDLSFSYGNEVYQLDGKLYNRLGGKRIEVYEKRGKIKYVEFNGKKIGYKKWKEKAFQPEEIRDAKELEVLWATRKRKPGKYHPWR